MKQPYVSYRNAIAAGQVWDIPVYGTMFRVLYNSLSTNPEVAIDNSQFSEIAAGIGPAKLDPFKMLSFRNTSGSTMELWIAVSTGEIDDARAAFNEQISITDVSDAIETPASIIAQDIDGWLIDNAAAVDVGGGLVGIPITGHTFVAGDIVNFSGTVNYNDTYTIASVIADQINITETYVAETFDGIDDTVTPAIKSIAANSDRKEIIINNLDATRTLWIGDSNIDPANYRGQPVYAQSSFILTSTAKIYFAADSGVGIAGVRISYTELTRS